MTINAFGTLRGDLNLTDNLQLEDVSFIYWETIPMFQCLLQLLLMVLE